MIVPVFRPRIARLRFGSRPYQLPQPLRQDEFQQVFSAWSPMIRGRRFSQLYSFKLDSFAPLKHVSHEL